MIRTLQLLLLPLLLPFIACAQNITFSSSHQGRSRINYVKEPVGFEKNANLILREIGKENLVDPMYVRIYIAANVDVLASISGDGSHLVSIFARNLEAGGETRYRKFDISGVLIPSGINISLIYQSKSDSNQHTAFLFPSALPGEPGTPAASISLPKFDPSTDTLIADIRGVSYNEECLVRFMNRLQQINDYFAASLLLDSLEKQESRIDAGSASLMPGNFFRVDGIAKAVSLIMSKGLDSLILTGGADPGNIMTRLKEVYRRSRSLVYTFNETLDNNPVIPWDGNSRQVANVLVEGMMRYIAMSARMNDLNGALFQEYLRDYFQMNVFSTDDEFRKLTTRMYPAIPADSALKVMSDAIFGAFVEKIHDLVRNDAYSEAFDLLRVLSDFSEAYPGDYNPSVIDSLESVAATGVFSSYLGIAQSCIGQGKFLMAENYMGRALEYRRQYPLWIPSDSLYGMVFSQLFTRRLEVCDTKLEQGSYQDAITCYTAFEKRFNPEEVALVKEQVHEKIARARVLLLEEDIAKSFNAYKEEEPDSALYWYEQAVEVRKLIAPGAVDTNAMDSLTVLILPLKFDYYSSTGTYALQRRNFSQAYSALYSADSIARLAGLQTDSLFRANLLDAFRHHLLDEISTNTGFIWNNKFDSAYAWIDMIRQEAAGKGLGSDSILVNAFQNYTGKIKARQCSNNREDAELLWIRATRNIDAGRYIVAFQQAESVSRIISLNPGCKISIPGISDTLWKYQPAFNYQQLLDSLKILVAIGNYTPSVTLMIEAESNFSENHLSGFGFDTFRVYDFIKTRGNINLTRAALDYYLDHAETEEAFRYLYLLEIEGYQAKEARPLQENLGKLIAERDYRTDPAGDPLIRLSGLCGSDSWYDSFRKAYSEEWKKQKSK